MNLLRAATLVTPDVSAAAARYAQWLDYRLVEEGTIRSDLAHSWDAPGSGGRAYAVLRPASGADVFLRFVHGDPVPAYEPLRTYGWAAIEICNQNVEQVHRGLLNSPFEIIGPPTLIEGLPTIYPMQVKGPDKEIVYLTEIKDLSEGSGLPKPKSLIDHLFILVLACRDMAASQAWFCSRLGLTMDASLSLIYTLINDAFSLPPDATHVITTAGYGGDTFLEFDQYPPLAGPRPQHFGQLPPGVAICTLRHPDLDAITAPWLTPPSKREGLIYGGRRAGTFKGPDGALMEVVEG